MIGLNETVTWQAKHLFKNRRLQVLIAAMNAPHAFTDEQVIGDFSFLRHEHYFKSCDNGTIMIDKFYFETPYGFIGRLVNKVWLTAYMERLLQQRNSIIKKTAESNIWIQFLKE